MLGLKSKVCGCKHTAPLGTRDVCPCRELSQITNFLFVFSAKGWELLGRCARCPSCSPIGQVVCFEGSVQNSQEGIQTGENKSLSHRQDIRILLCAVRCGTTSGYMGRGVGGGGVGIKERWYKKVWRKNGGEACVKLHQCV